jgi:hypothetical protein
VSGQHHAPAALPPRKTRYPLYKSLSGPQGQSGRVRKISRLPEFDPRTVQPVASRYTDWAIKIEYIFQLYNEASDWSLTSPFKDYFYQLKNLRSA